METKQLVLKRTLEAINEDLEVQGLENRLRLQKAIYLIQAAGADLGYRYSWYIRGPYSTGLTQDYFALAEIDRNDDARVLNVNFLEKVRTASKVLSIPKKLNVKKHEWYELLASLHFMSKEEKLKDPTLTKTLKQRKPHLGHLVSDGIQHLKSYALL